MMDIDAANGFIDFTVGSIDVANGNITDTTVTLATHKHRQVGGTLADGDGPTKQVETTVANESAPPDEE